MLKSNSTETASVDCPVQIDVSARTIKIFTNADINYSYAKGTWINRLNDTQSFGPNGKVKVAGFNVLRHYDNTASSILTKLNSFKPDIIHLGYNAWLESAINTMYDYARANDIPIIIAIENSEQAIINHIYPGVFTVGGAISGNFDLNATVAANDPLKYGPFSPVGTGTATVIKDGYGDKWLNYTSLPSTIVPYMTNGSSIGMFRDDSKALIYCPDAGILNAANPTNGTGEFFSNAIAWAIDYLNNK